jgi:ABC-type lipoprotein release transport system permease subunit
MIKLALQEAAHRKFTFWLSALAIVFAVGLVVFFLTTSEASNRETIRLTRDMGFNLRIIPRNTDMDFFWMRGFSDQMMPEEWVERFVNHPGISYAHVTATLQQRIDWQDRKVVLTGLSREIEPAGKSKTDMTYHLPAGRVIVGYGPAHAFAVKQGQAVHILGSEFVVDNVLAETGSEEDEWIYMDLPSLQKLLHLEGRISEIKALNCLCLTTDKQDPLAMLREQLKEILPDAQVIMNKTIAMARERQRLTMERYFAFLLPVLLLGCAVWIATLSMINVQNRTNEVGVWRSLGYASGWIFGLFLLRALLLGLAGGLAGFLFGTLAALQWGPAIFKITGKTIMPIYSLLAWSCGLAPLFAGLASLLPAVYAVNRDPAELLREK